MPMSEQDIFMTCKKRVNINKLTAKNYTLCIDGTSCTKKSSILARTGRLVSKNQRVNPSQNADTYFPSMIGYITSGIANLTVGGPHFEDRSPLNVLDWHILWKLFDDYVKRFGNSIPNVANPDMDQCLLNYRTVFQTYKEWYIYKMFAEDINTIAIIDSDVLRCDSLRYARDIASDRERSLWRFYTPLQNLMYEELYPETHIDLKWFGNADVDDVVNGIARFLNYVLSCLENRRNLDYPSLIDRRLPTIKSDLTLGNITTHVYRSIGRHGCRQILGQFKNDNQPNEDLQARIPQYLYVTNICTPMGTYGPPIVPAIRSYYITNNTSINNDIVEPEATEYDCAPSDMF